MSDAESHPRPLTPCHSPFAPRHSPFAPCHSPFAPRPSGQTPGIFM
ncbi:Uncharacterized protein dnm_064740 [Desulfonema magnum]|uniref:Uncharacterized protein n=1 Tax=Desulfonema magnum TaxID=45655 RepID=A0A975BRS5_9BACT|nr:Uncharacterized protein dnm_064740 [Desulfonema magnum]